MLGGYGELGMLIKLLVGMQNCQALYNTIWQLLK
jgi:hypothetical protein